MQLTDEQKAKVQEWIGAGLKLSEIQDRLDKELGVRLTYMDARLLIDDLKLTPLDPVMEQPAAPPADAQPGGEMEDFGTGEPPFPDEAMQADAPVGGGKLSLTVDQITRAGAMVSGRVTFSDGKSAEWYLDQYGRFGLVPPEPGYRPSQSDLAEFQVKLDRELAKLGY